MKHSMTLLAMLALLTAPVKLDAQEQDTLDAETQKLWDAHTVVPKTDDVKELRAFLQYGNDKWIQMNGRMRGENMWERYRTEKNKATFEAADRIIALSKNEPGEEPPPPKDWRDYPGWNDDDDLKFALIAKIGAYNRAREWNPDWEQQFRDLIEEIRKNPAHKYILKFAEASWFCHHFNAAAWPKGVHGEEPAFEESLRLYEENFENLKRYYAENADDPYLKYQFDHTRDNHQQAAENIEGRGKLKKGTLAKPSLEFYRDLYEKHSDAREAEGYLRNIKNALVKYDILTADDPLAAFQVKVEELKQSLEAELNEDSWLKVSGLSQIADEMDRRNEALRLLYTTVRPVFEASENEKIRDWVLGYDITLNHLALEGVEFELEAVLVDGTKIDLKDYRGKVVVLDYWATWCGPCIGDMPLLKTFYENWHRDRDVELIGFSVDDDLDALKAFIEKEQLAWPNVSGKLSQRQNLPDSQSKYNINAYPTTILIDQNGKVVRAGSGLYSIIREVGKLFPVEDEK
ncbi:MAG: TlpA family protein disulfide reductase [Planctomycetaceae bacterium]|nr:TlpA family protein disulfide reductase [Planctomycetaceae bacterium]